MTTHRQHRCAHCGNHYSYQASGHGCLEPENDGTYCPTCKQAQLDAFDKIPRRFEARYQDIRQIPRFADITTEMVLAWEQTETTIRERRRAAGEIIGQRIFPGLVDMKKGEFQYIREVRAQDGPHAGLRLKVASWPSAPTDCEIEYPMEYDLAEKRFTGRDWS